MARLNDRERALPAVPDVPMDWLLAHQHAWDVSPTEAVAFQRRLATEVVEAPVADTLGRAPRTVAGLDVSIRGDLAQAAIVVVDLETMETVDEAVYRAEVPFPYISGLLSFREVPVLLPALARLRVRPDVLMLDAQGRAHPRRLGLASHLGVMLDVPAFGVAKTLFVGRFDDLGTERGSTAPLVHRDEVVGAAVRTRTNVTPVYVSVGHRMALDEAIAMALATSVTRIPEPTRRAHHLSRVTSET